MLAGESVGFKYVEGCRGSRVFVLLYCTLSKPRQRQLNASYAAAAAAAPAAAAAAAAGDNGGGGGDDGGGCGGGAAAAGAAAAEG